MSNDEGHFTLHGQQAARLIGAHQRQIVPITSPTAVRHLALWQGYDLPEIEANRDRIAQEDNFISDFYRALLSNAKAMAISPPADRDTFA